MFFNLIVGFPLMWKRSNSIDRYREAMAAQGMTNCATVISPCHVHICFGLVDLLDDAVADVADGVSSDRHGLWAGMLFHLDGTLALWPKIIFSADEEALGLFWRYKLSMIGSTTFGVVAITASYYWSIVR